MRSLYSSEQCSTPRDISSAKIALIQLILVVKNFGVLQLFKVLLACLVNTYNAKCQSYAYSLYSVLDCGDRNIAPGADYECGSWVLGYGYGCETMGEDTGIYEYEAMGAGMSTRSWLRV